MILAVSAELLAGGSDGHRHPDARERRRSATSRRVYAVTVVTGLIGLVLIGVLGLVERRLFAWTDAERSRS